MAQSLPTQPAEAVSPQTGHLMRIAVAGAAVLVVAGAIAFYWTAQISKQRAAAPGVATVTINASECQPDALTVPAGKAGFKVVNASDRVLEWEILDGVMVVAEKENITPGLSVLVNAELQPGEYQITCGLLSNPRGKLLATPTTVAGAPAAKPKLVAFIGPLAEYRTYVALETGAMGQNLRKLADAIRSGDAKLAQTLFGSAYDGYKHIEPLAQHFADLQNTMDASAQYLEKREADPAFTGFHRIEYGLWGKDSTEGLAAVADKLAVDADALKARLKALELPPQALAQGAVSLLTQIADNRVLAGEEPYRHQELAGLDANLVGVSKIIDLLRPLAAAAAPEVLARIDAALAASRQALAELEVGGAYPAYDTVAADKRRALADRLRVLAEELDKLNPAIGLV